MPGGDDLVEHDDEEVRVGAGEDGDVHGDGRRVRLVQTHPEVALAAQQQQDEDAYSWIRYILVQAVNDSILPSPSCQGNMALAKPSTYVHESDPALVGPGVVEVVEDGGEDVEDVGGLEDEEEELLVVLAELPEEDEELLVEGHLPLAVRQVRLHQRVHQQPGGNGFTSA